MRPADEEGTGARLIANLGGEEGPGRGASAESAVRTAARLWQLLFGPGTRQLIARSSGGPDTADRFPEHAAPEETARSAGSRKQVSGPKGRCNADKSVWAASPEPAEWPEGLGAPARAPVFPWLEDAGGWVPWLSTPEAERAALSAGARYAAAASETVARVHDKAFAHRTAVEERLVPPELRGLTAVFAPDELRNADGAIARMQAELDGWPEWARDSFTLKPRLGSSGRGRVPGKGGSADSADIRGALPRLADRGGALLEPWLERLGDFSTQLYIGDGAEDGVLLLGSSELLTTPAGLYRGHRGQVDSRGRIFSSWPEDESLRNDAAVVAASAREAGYRGPCGVDALRFRGVSGGPELRPVVELNARFTLGIVAIGLVRRALPLLRERLGLRPGDRRAFELGLDEPEQGWQETAQQLGDDGFVVPLSHPDELQKPALLFATPC